MKPTTQTQAMVYAQYRNDCTEKNGTNIVLWQERRMAFDIMTNYFGERQWLNQKS